MRRTLAQIAGITAPQRYREGGHVRGPGTSTSDSIPARLSDGEFVLPADTVRKVGVKSLRDLVHATHTPVKGRPGRHNYANGDLVDDKPDRANSFGDAAAVAQNPGVTQVAAPAPAPAKAAATGGGLQGVADRAMNFAPAAPAATPTPTVQAVPSTITRPGASSFGDSAAASLDSRVAQIPTGGQTAPAADGSQDRWSNTETGRNLSNIASALPGSLGGAIPAIAKTGGAISGGIDAATRLLNAGAGAAAISAIPGAASAQSPAFPPSPAGAGRGMVNPTSVNPNAPAPLSPERSPVGDRIVNGPSSDVTRVGNSYSGTNVTGDITINGQAPRNGGAISPQNMSAADNLAAGQSQGARERLLAAGMSAVPGVQAPVVRNSTNDWAARNALRNAEVSAGSIMNRKEWNRAGVADSEGKVAGFRAAQAADLALQQAQPGMDQTAMRENAGIQREGMQQAGETQRTGIRAEGVEGANQIARGRLTLEQIAAGYTNRSADRIDRAQAEVESAKTPEAQKSARERLMALAGKEPQNEWGLQVTPATKNLDGTTTQGSIYRYNKATGETARVDEGQGSAGQAPAKENMVRGQVYQTKGGPLRWNGSSFERVG